MTLQKPSPPQGLSRFLFRIPIFFYRIGLGWLLGGRFLKLTHIGRKSGVPREVVLETVYHDKVTDLYYIASGWGAKANWFQNIRKTPQVTVQVGRRKFKATATWLAQEQARAILTTYGEMHPKALLNLARFMLGEKLDSIAANVEKLVEQVPVVEVKPEDIA